MQNLLDPTKTIGEAHGLEVGSIVPLLSRSFICLSASACIARASRSGGALPVWIRCLITPVLPISSSPDETTICNLVMMLRRKFFNTGLVQILKKDGTLAASWFIVVLHTSFFSFKASQLNTGLMLPTDMFFFIVRYLSVGVNTLKGMKPGFLLSRSTTTLAITAPALSSSLFYDSIMLSPLIPECLLIFPGIRISCPSVIVTVSRSTK